MHPQLMKKVYQLHRRDPNFPEAVIDKIELFLSKAPRDCHSLGA